MNLTWLLKRSTLELIEQLDGGEPFLPNSPERFRSEHKLMTDDVTGGVGGGVAYKKKTGDLVW